MLDVVRKICTATSSPFGSNPWYVLLSFPDFIAPWSSFKIPVFNILRTVIIVRRSKTSSSDFVSSLHFILTLRSLSYRTSRRLTFSSTLSLKETPSFLYKPKRISTAAWVGLTYAGRRVRNALGSNCILQIEKAHGGFSV